MNSEKSCVMFKNEDAQWPSFDIKKNLTKEGTIQPLIDKVNNALD